MKYVLDASAVVAFFKGERGGEIVRKILYAPAGSCCIHSVNWIELYYKLYRSDGEAMAESAVNSLRVLDVALTDITGEDFKRQVARLKIDYPAFSLADCHAVALAERFNAVVVTSDKRFSDAHSIVEVKQIR